MRSFRRAREPVEEGESYFVSMTDMMVGIIFIFIIMLSFFALQYRSTTSSLMQAKDAQTSVLLQAATHLQKQEAGIEIDRQTHVLCVPANLLVSGDDGRRCFAYSGEPTTPNPTAKTDEARKNALGLIGADLSSTPAQVSADAGAVTYAADRLFQPGSADLSDEGRRITQTLAASLALRLPCYGYGAPPVGSCTGQKMAVVNIVTSASFDAYTEAGRGLAALALRRSVAFHDALVAERPVLGQLSNAPAGQPGAQPLLRVGSVGQSAVAAPPAGQGQSLTIQFQMAP